MSTGRVPRPMRRKVVKGARVITFKRSQATTISLNPTSLPTGWALNNNGLVQIYVTGLSSIPGSSDFTNLFDSYRLVGVRLQGFYSTSAAVGDEGQSAMMYIAPNHLGDVAAADLTEQWFNDRPRSKHKLLQNTNAKPAFDEYLPLSQLSETYQSATGTDYALVSPKFISTAETSTPHYGACIRLQRVDGAVFSTYATNYPSIKIIETWYIQMRGVC